jgi:hypothetical protein
VPLSARDSSSLRQRPGSAPPARFRSRELVALSILLIIAAWLRLANLGALGLQVDEGVQALAVQGWLDTGLPMLPSGTDRTEDPRYSIAHTNPKGQEMGSNSRSQSR